MPISFGRPKDDDVVSLIAAKNYARAVELLKSQLRRKGANPSLRMQLADVLILAGKPSEAVSLLLPLADEYASEGFAAKAVSVLKKVQRIEPRRRDVDARLARLIQEKQREAGSGAMQDGPALEIGIEAGTPVSAPAGSVQVPVSSQSSRRPPAADPDQTLPADSLVPPPPRFVPQDLPPGAEPELLPELAPLPLATDGLVFEAGAKGAQPIEDYDLLYLGEAETDEPLELSPVEAGGSPMSAGQFADELMALVDDVFRDSSAVPVPKTAAARASGTQIVASPLFRDFSVDEMMAVIEGLKLLSFERGDVILREGDAGASLYMLTSGRVRAFRRNSRTGKQDPLADLDEGAFFGELSILTGQPRTASVVALSRCELLELDRPALDEITKTHPRVWDVLREFAGRRAVSPR